MGKPSRRRSATTTANAGLAAAEPEPPPSASTSAAESERATTTYNVRDYQNPDAGLSDLALTKGGGKGGKGGKGGGTTGKGKGAIRSCFSCGRASAKLCSCSRCRRAFYCDEACQRKDWKRHQRACRAAVAAEARRATRAREALEAARAAGGRPANETCVICIGPAVAPVELPCGHAYCASPCLAELRRQGVAQACPQCRGEVPLGLDGLFDLAFRAYLRIRGMVTRGEVAWASLPAAAREELDGAVAMLTEAAAQGHKQADGMINLVKLDPRSVGAHINLGVMLQSERRDIDGAEAAYRAVIATDPASYSVAQTNLGILLDQERKDIDGAEAAYRAAIAADCQGCARAHTNLGMLLQHERKDIDGAEAAYRAAVAADPRYASAHVHLGILLMTVRKDIDGAEAAYRAAIAVDPGYAEIGRASCRERV